MQYLCCSRISSPCQVRITCALSTVGDSGCATRAADDHLSICDFGLNAPPYVSRPAKLVDMRCRAALKEIYLACEYLAPDVLTEVWGRGPVGRRRKNPKRQAFVAVAGR